MPILTLQRRLVEVGRLRLGDTTQTKGGKTRPVRLETWKVTSRDERRLKAVAALYGGDVTPWPRREGEYQVLTDTKVLDVAVIPKTALSSFLELWGQAQTAEGKPGAFQCMRRCDGVEELLRREPCLCRAEMDLAGDDSATPQCKPITQLNVMLPRVPGVGSWRLKTNSYYAAMELAGTVDLLQTLSESAGMVGARLRIDKRRAVRDGQTTVFPVPVLDLDTSLLEVASGEAPLAYRPLDDGAPRELEQASAPELGVASDPSSEEAKPKRQRKKKEPEPSPPEAAAEPEPAAETKAKGNAKGNGRRTQAPVGEEAPDPEPPGEAATQNEEDLASRAQAALADAEADPEEEASKAPISRAQRQRMHALAKEKIEGSSNHDAADELGRIVMDVTGSATIGSMTQLQYETVISHIEAWDAIPFGEGEQATLRDTA